MHACTCNEYIVMTHLGVVGSSARLKLMTQKYSVEEGGDPQHCCCGWSLPEGLAVLVVLSWECPLGLEQHSL